jgi:serine phosphatase RsbU (regulator of sigma subunit)
LGVAREWNAERPEPVQLANGGRLVFLTDGIHESMNPAGELFGLDRVAVFLDSHPELSPIDLVSALVQTAQAWRGPGELLDDQAILVAGRGC